MYDDMFMVLTLTALIGRLYVFLSLDMFVFSFFFAVLLVINCVLLSQISY